MDRQADERILQGLLQNDCRAFDELYMRYAPHVEAFAYCLLKNRFPVLVQLEFLK